MFTKSLIAAALAVALSGTAFAGQVYQGGPKSGLTARVQTFEPNKPFAQALDVRANKHTYQGGPKVTAPHGR